MTMFHIDKGNRPIEIFLDRLGSCSTLEDKFNLLKLQDENGLTALHHCAINHTESKKIAALLTGVTPEKKIELLKIKDSTGMPVLLKYATYYNTDCGGDTRVKYEGALSSVLKVLFTDINAKDVKELTDYSAKLKVSNSRLGREISFMGYLSAFAMTQSLILVNGYRENGGPKSAPEPSALEPSANNSFTAKKVVGVLATTALLGGGIAMLTIGIKTLNKALFGIGIALIIVGAICACCLGYYFLGPQSKVTESTESKVDDGRLLTTDK